MKRQITLSFFTAVLFLGGMFYSCSKEVAYQENEMNLKAGKIKVAAAPVVYNSGGDCELCINASNPVYYKDNYSTVVNWGNDNTKTVELDVYNTETDFVIEVTSTLKIGDVVVDGISKGIGTNEPGSDGKFHATYSYPLTEGWTSCQTITHLIQVAAIGPQAEFSVNYKLHGICVTCEESFSYVVNGNNSYTFTYIPSENNPQATLVFTFAQSVVVTGLDGWSTNGATSQKTMDLAACQPYNWTVSLTPDCSGVGNKKSNGWTDFKVNDISKKGSLSNIEITCP